MRTMKNTCDVRITEAGAVRVEINHVWAEVHPETARTLLRKLQAVVADPAAATEQGEG